MFYRKDAVSLAVLSLLASAGFAMAENTNVKTPALSLNPSVALADDAAAAAPDRAPLMMALDKVGAAKPLDSLGLNIYGFIDSGYTWDHRSRSTPIEPGGNQGSASDRGSSNFNHEFHNHYMLNQVTVRFERLVDSKKWDVGGMVEVTYGTDAAGIHSNGLSYGNETRSGKGGTSGPNNFADDRFNPQYQFDIIQAYIDVNVPVGNGLKIRAGKFVALAGYETIDPRSNPFYSHSYLFYSVPGTQTGILGFYQLNDQWSVAAGVSRGWDQALEDNNGAIDALGQIAWTPNKQWAVYLNWTTGPENDFDTSHYRTLINPIITWQVTDALKLGVEGLYVYDGGVNAEEKNTGVTHAYGDQWGVAVYAGYTVNDYLTVNARGEKFHSYSDAGVLGDVSDSLNTDPSIPNVNVYEVTLGVTVTPMPKDPIMKNLMIRPEVRYDFSEDHMFVTGSQGQNAFKDQLTFAADVIFKF